MVVNPMLGTDIEAYEDTVALAVSALVPTSGVFVFVGLHLGDTEDLMQRVTLLGVQATCSVIQAS